MTSHPLPQGRGSTACCPGACIEVGSALLMPPCHHAHVPPRGSAVLAGMTGPGILRLR